MEIYKQLVKYTIYKIYKKRSIICLFVFAWIVFGYFLWLGHDLKTPGTIYNDSSSIQVQDENNTSPVNSQQLASCSFNKTLYNSRINHGHRNNANHYESKAPVFTKFATTADIPQVQVTKADCAAIMTNDKTAYLNALNQDRHYVPVRELDKELHNLVSDCNRFLSTRNYLTSPIDKEEAEFPIAYSIIAYKDAFQIERLLRTIYRPHNMYCIHIDKKAIYPIFEIMWKIGKCLPNVLVVDEDRLHVRWGWFPVLQADLLCMQMLLERYAHWKYFINLTGQEFPLKTNLEIVKVLKTFKGGNDIEGRVMTGQDRELRVKYDVLGTTRSLKTAFKHNITFYKGAVHMAATREFAEFVLHSGIAKDLLNYLKYTWVPEETFFATLNYNPVFEAPGAYTGCLDVTDQSTIRYKLWKYENQTFTKPKVRTTHFNSSKLSPQRHEIESDRIKHFALNRRKLLSNGHALDSNRNKYYSEICHGVVVRNICVLALGDLAQVTHSNKLFVNKLFSSYSPLTSDCLEEYIWKKVEQEIHGLHTLDLSYYEMRDYVNNHI